MANYQFQGTDGCYESARAKGENDRIWLRSRSKGDQIWDNLDVLAEEFMPKSWRTYGKLATQSAHGVSDFLELVDFVENHPSKRKTDHGIHETMDMTLPGLVSQQSIAEHGRWFDVPDSREW